MGSLYRLNVDNALDLPGSAENKKEWVVLRTRPRCEKKVARFCEGQGASVFLPLLSRTHRYGGRTRTFTSPLFAGYVFALLNMDQFNKVQRYQHVARLLRTVDQLGLVRQLCAIRRALNENEVVEVLPFLVEGRHVMVKFGPMKGFEGVIQRRKGKTRVVINVEMIQHSVAVELDSQDLAPV